MSRSYEMQFSIDDKGLSDAERTMAFEVIEGIWNLDSEFETYDQRVWTSYGTSSLCGGESDLEFAERVSKLVDKEVGKPVPLKVRAVYLEELPYQDYEFHDFDEDDDED